VSFQRKIVWLALVAALSVATGGCGGINASHSISPASFLLPGLLKAQPRPAPADETLPDAAPAREVALAR
jgi:hypothetical protein